MVPVGESASIRIHFLLLSLEKGWREIESAVFPDQDAFTTDSVTLSTMVSTRLHSHFRANDLQDRLEINQKAREVRGRL
jgi:hypothetical protein